MNLKPPNRYAPLIITTNSILPASFPISTFRSLKKELLNSIYFNDIIDDGYTSGVVGLENGEFKIIVGRDFPSMAGLLFEAFVVRKAREDREFLKEIYKWALDLQKKPSDKEIESIKLFGLGFPSTKEYLPQLYSPQDYNKDVGFLKSKKQTIVSIVFNDDQLNTKQETTVITSKNGLIPGVQIKAITSNEKKEIIEPILKGQYTHVLTLLRNKKTNKPSIEICRSILEKMVRDKEIDIKTRYKVEKSIRSPESLCIKQEEVDEYYESIGNWYVDGMKNKGFIKNPLGQQIASGIIQLDD